MNNTLNKYINKWKYIEMENGGLQGISQVVFLIVKLKVKTHIFDL